MPQMSPMNWLLISMLFLTIKTIFKMNYNMSLKNKTQNPMKQNIKKNTLEW